MVTTPQDVATGDVRRGVRMFEKVNTRVLGIVENMSGYQCPHCGEGVDIFGRGGGEALAKDWASLPGQGTPGRPGREAGDVGEPTVNRSPDSPAGRHSRRSHGRSWPSLEEAGRGVIPPPSFLRPLPRTSGASGPRGGPGLPRASPGPGSAQVMPWSVGARLLSEVAGGAGVGGESSPSSPGGGGEAEGKVMRRITLLTDFGTGTDTWAP
jgi:hypothetical protein